MTEREIIRRCPLFEGLDGAQAQRALDFFHACRTVYPKGAQALKAGLPVTRFALVLRGSVQVLMTDLTGRETILAEASCGDTFAESMCFLGVKESPVYAVVCAQTVVLWMDCGMVRAADADPFHALLRNRFTAMLAGRTLSMNRRIQALCRHTLRGKLSMLFVQYAQKAGSRSFTLPFSRTDLAAYLGAHRSSLTRELKAMTDEGLIRLEGRQVTLLKDLNVSE